MAFSFAAAAARLAGVFFTAGFFVSCASSTPASPPAYPGKSYSIPDAAIFLRRCLSLLFSAVVLFFCSSAVRSLSCTSAAFFCQGTCLNFLFAPFHISGWHSSSVIRRTLRTDSKRR